MKYNWYDLNISNVAIYKLELIFHLVLYYECMNEWGDCTERVLIYKMKFLWGYVGINTLLWHKNACLYSTP